MGQSCVKQKSASIHRDHRVYRTSADEQGPGGRGVARWRQRQFHWFKKEGKNTPLRDFAWGKNGIQREKHKPGRRDGAEEGKGTARPRNGGISFHQGDTLTYRRK